MGLTAKPLERYAVRGAIYDLENAGDVFPVHTHAAANNHITIVARGSIRVEGHPDHAGRVLKAGDVVDWPAAKAHGFVALEDATRLVNIRKIDPPADPKS